MAMPGDNMVGKMIILKVDELVEVLTEIVLSGGRDVSEYQQEGLSLLRELNKMLEKVLGPQQKYLYQAVKELVIQRLPEKSSLKEEICNHLQELLRSAGSVHLDKSEGKPQAHDILKDDTQKALALLFPYEGIIRDYCLKGCHLDYYLPAYKVAVVDNSNTRVKERARREYICQSEGIKLISIDKGKCSGYRELARVIRRQMRGLANK